MASNHLPTLYQEFIHLSRYSRWLPEKGRRETWGETIDRYFTFFGEHLKQMHDYDLKPALRKKIEEAILFLMSCLLCLLLSWVFFVFYISSKFRKVDETKRKEFAFV